MEAFDRLADELVSFFAAYDGWRRGAHRGSPVSLAEELRPFSFAVHDEGGEILAGESGLLAAWRLARAISSAAADEDAILRWELAARLDDGVSLRAARRRLRMEAEGNRRARLHEAVVREEEKGRSLRADRLERLRERHAPDAPGAAAADAEAILQASEDAFSELLPWVQARARIENLRPCDLPFLLGGRAESSAFPSGGLRLAVNGLVEAMGVTGWRRGLRLELEPKAEARIGVDVAALRMPGLVTIGLSPDGLAEDWRELFSALPRGLRFCLLQPRRRFSDDVFARSASWVFGSLLLQPAWLRRSLGLGRRAAADAIRALATLELLRLRRVASRVLAELHLWEHGTRASTLREAGEIFGRFCALPLSGDEVLAGIDPAFPAASELAGALRAASLESELRERFDEDWFRNPRSGPWLEKALVEPPDLATSATDVQAALLRGV